MLTSTINMLIEFKKIKKGYVIIHAEENTVFSLQRTLYVAIINLRTISVIVATRNIGKFLVNVRMFINWDAYRCEFLILAFLI